MRPPVISLSLLLPQLLALVLTAAGASAEIIHLKNGRTIYADHVRTNGNHVEYDIGDDSYAIPKSLVERIEAGVIPARDSSSSSRDKDFQDLPSFPVTLELKTQAGLTDLIIHDGSVDSAALAALEKRGDDSATATGYLIAGKHELEKGNLSQARSYLEAALHFDPDDPTILNYYVGLLLRANNPAAALHYAEHAAHVAPGSPETLAMLGYAQFASDRTREAIRSWKHSLELRPDPGLQQHLEKAEREASAETDFLQRESIHFTLRYEGKQTSESFRHELVAVLESQYDDLVRALGVAPRASIPVVLYTDQAFFDVTQSPSWAGAVNDGKLRIPVDGVSSVTPELAHVLRHELAHSFVNQLSGGRCPQWLNEGIAQALEPKSLSSHGRTLAQLFRAQREIPFNALEGSFMRLSGIQAVLAYDESLAAVEYINETYGMSDLQRILERLGQGSSPEAALRATIHSDYGQLQNEVAGYLVSKYGE